MSEWAPKRFWTATEVESRDAGFTVTLDGRNVKTPAKRALIVPTERMAREIAREWDAQEERIDPTSMPWTRSRHPMMSTALKSTGSKIGRPTWTPC